MSRERFDESFERLREQSNRHADTERSAENLDEVVAGRVELDRRRKENTDDRKQVVSRYEPPAPDVVEPHRGYMHTRLFGKVGAAIAAALLAVIVILVAVIVQRVGDGFALEIEDVVESVDATDGCRWRVETTVRNDSDQTITIERVQTVLDREERGGVPVGPLPTLAPGATATVVADWNLASAGDCPAVDDINHGNIVFVLDNGVTVSRGL